MSDTKEEEFAGSGNDELDDLLEAAAAQEELDEDEVELDLSESAEYEPFEGQFAAQFTKVEFTHAKGGTKGPMLKTELTVIEEGDHKGRRAWPNLMLGGRGAWKTKQAYAAAGVELDLDATPVKIKPKALKNKVVFVTFEIKSQEGYKDKTEATGFAEVPLDNVDELA